jgi:mitotic spindle assembly checkpoint protein MAD1
VEEYKHVSERTKLEAAIAADKAQAQLDESASRIDLLERHRAVLLAKEREASERADRKKQDEDGEKAKFEKQARDLRQQLDQLQDEHADLQASFSDLEHSASQAIAQANSHQQRTAGLQQEIEHVRSEAEEQRQQATQERQRRINVEAELEQEKLKARSAGDSAIIREELHRKSKKVQLSFPTRTDRDPTCRSSLNIAHARKGQCETAAASGDVRAAARQC